MYVIYNKDTTKQHSVPTQHVRCYRDTWATERAAKGARTRSKLDTNVWLIAEIGDFRTNIEKTEIVYSIHDTKKERPITQSINTPYTSSPASESYWSA